MNVICHIYLKSLFAAGSIGEILETVCEAAQRSIVACEKTAGKAAARSRDVRDGLMPPDCYIPVNSRA